MRVYGVLTMFFEKHWRFKLVDEFRYASPLLKGVTFENPWVKINDGVITINKDYAWDGCSPAYKLHLGKLLPQGLWFGTWDGPLNTNCLPVTHRAALVHDALCQFRNMMHVSKKQSVEIFKELLVLDNAPKWMCVIYPIVVSLFGPQNWEIK